MAKDAEMEAVRQMTGAGSLSLEVARIVQGGPPEHVVTYEGLSAQAAQNPYTQVLRAHGPGHYQFKVFKPGDAKEKPSVWDKVLQAPPPLDPFLAALPMAAPGVPMAGALGALPPGYTPTMAGSIPIASVPIGGGAQPFGAQQVAAQPWPPAAGQGFGGYGVQGFAGLPYGAQGFVGQPYTAQGYGAQPWWLAQQAALAQQYGAQQVAPGAREDDFWRGNPWMSLMRMMPPWQAANLVMPGGGGAGQPQQPSPEVVRIGAEMVALKESLTALRDAVKEGARRPAEDDQVRALREEMRSLRESHAQQAATAALASKIDGMQAAMVAQQGGGQSAVLVEAFKSSAQQSQAMLAQQAQAAMQASDATKHMLAAATQRDPVVETLLKAQLESQSPERMAAVTKASVEVMSTGVAMIKGAMETMMDAGHGDPPWVPIMQTAFEKLGRIGETIASRGTSTRGSGGRSAAGQLGGAPEQKKIEPPKQEASATGGAVADAANGAAAAPSTTANGDRFGPLRPFIERVRQRAASGVDAEEVAELFMNLYGIAEGLGFTAQEIPILGEIARDPSAAMAEVLPEVDEGRRLQILSVCDRIVKENREDAAAEA